MVCQAIWELHQIRRTTIVMVGQLVPFSEPRTYTRRSLHSGRYKSFCLLVPKIGIGLIPNNKALFKYHGKIGINKDNTQSITGKQKHHAKMTSAGQSHLEAQSMRAGLLSAKLQGSICENSLKLLHILFCNIQHIFYTHRDYFKNSVKLPHIDSFVANVKYKCL